MEHMARKDGKARIGIAFCLDNPEHKRAYDILQAADNKNQLIRDAIVAYVQDRDYIYQLPTRHEVEEIVKNAIERALSQNQSCPKEKEIADKDVDSSVSNGIDMEKLKKYL